MLWPLSVLTPFGSFPSPAFLGRERIGVEATVLLGGASWCPRRNFVFFGATCRIFRRHVRADLYPERDSIIEA